MSMSTTVGRFDRQPQATTGNHRQPDHTQRELRILTEAPPAQELQLLPVGSLTTSTFDQVLWHSALAAGRDHEDLADAIHISKGYMSRFMNGVAQQWARRIVAYMRATRCLGPLQWMADQVGCDITVRSAISAELAAARARVADLERSGRAIA